ncbi:MAG: DJ-1/PfpI family protein [Saprospiraceae bacterium]|nr:DJ-1/PfpI family protein [Saprospiraceae bacterium]
MTKNRTSIAFYLQDGVEVLDFAGPLEVFSYADYEIYIVSHSKDPIRSQGILQIVPTYSLDDVPKADIIAFFGGNSQQAFKGKEITDWITKQGEDQNYFSVCTGAFALAKAGLLDDKKAATFHLMEDQLAKDFPKVEVVKGARFVDEGRVITTAGVSAGIDGALHLVTKIDGIEKARSIAKMIEYDSWIPDQGLIVGGSNPYK